MAHRPILHHYQDPLSRIWLNCAAQVGYRVVRTADAYASTDGNRTLLIAEDAALDADDSLAQMILHELCHALVEGEAGEQQQDWGLDNTSGRDTWREHSCLRLQAYLAGSVGLRDFFAPTTDFRVRFWNDLLHDPLMASADKGGRYERSCVAARKGAWRASMPRWQLPLQNALKASASIAAAVATTAMMNDEGEQLPSLWSTTQIQLQLHPAGHAPIADEGVPKTCTDCAWCFTSRGSSRCQHAPTIKLPADAPACTLWEPAAELDCQRCGACCREAFDRVEVGARESVVKLHPEMIISAGSYRKLKRQGSRCAALIGGDDRSQYQCRIYDDRPKTCRDFTRGSDNCLQARRKVGLSL